MYFVKFCIVILFLIGKVLTDDDRIRSQQGKYQHFQLTDAATLTTYVQTTAVTVPGITTSTLDGLTVSSSTMNGQSIGSLQNSKACPLTTATYTITERNWIIYIYSNGGTGNQYLKMAQVTFTIVSSAINVIAVTAGYKAGDFSSSSCSDIVTAWTGKTTQPYATSAGNAGYGVASLVLSTIQPSSQPSNQPTGQPSRRPTIQPSGQPSRRPSTQPSGTPSTRPTGLQSAQPSSQPSRQPSTNPTRQPTSQPTYKPSDQPTSQPSSQPSVQPYADPTMPPSIQPSVKPSSQPSANPSHQPTSTPSRQPSSRPNAQPSTQPSRQPTTQPFVHPSAQPSCVPSMQPFLLPSSQPSSQPSRQPQCIPTVQPSSQPSTRPSSQPSDRPSSQPSRRPSSQPIARPSSQPSDQPRNSPTGQPNAIPSAQPSNRPSVQPSIKPSMQPSSKPSTQPSVRPSAQPTINPSVQPSAEPSRQPIQTPSSQPSTIPSLQPLALPSGKPSSQHVDTNNPTATPSEQPLTPPTRRPTIQLTNIPSTQPSGIPSDQPSGSPSRQPSNRPTSSPSTQRTVSPSSKPSDQPSSSPSLQPFATPSTHPSRSPSLQSSNRPSKRPSSHPSEQPILAPSSQPSAKPSKQPTSGPTCHPSTQLSERPSSQPSSNPSEQPVNKPSSQPSGQPSCQPYRRPSGQPSSQPRTRPTAQPTISPIKVLNQPSYTPSVFIPIPTCIPTVSPTHTLPQSTRLSVSYPSIGNSSFRIVLPFLFTNAVYGEDLTNVVLNDSMIGSNYLISFGSKMRIVSEVSVQSLFGISPAISYDFSGRSVSNAGDVNGDGFDDLIIGVPYASRCYVLYGTKHGFVNMTEGFTVFGAETSDMTGWSVSGAGDLNNDTIADVIIGAPNAADQRRGAVYVIYGKHTTVFNSIDLSNLQVGDGFVLSGTEIEDCLGLSVCGAGDINNDGFDDIIIGALRVNEQYSGATYIVYGSANSPIYSRSVTNTSTTTSLYGPAYSWFGFSVSGAGDVNGDGFDDVIIGSSPRRNTVTSPISYVIYGNKTINVTDVTQMTPSQGYVITGGGVVVSGVGDINGDGFDDVMIGGSDYGFDSGGGYVVFQPPQIVTTHAPSTTSPSFTPSTVPSITPTQTSTQPTFQPSIAPSGPTYSPSVQPTQPTSQPSATPTAPTLKPSAAPSSAIPTLVPSRSPSISPSRTPSTTPSVRPTVAPSPQPPSQQPSVIQTRVPTRRPVQYPTVQPTVLSTPRVTNQTVNVIEITTGGVYQRIDGNVTHYFVNATSDVTINGTSENKAVFTVEPNKNTTLTITQFNVSSDVVVLTSFTSINTFEDLLSVAIVSNDPSRRLSSHAMVLAINLGAGQYVILYNVHVSDLSLRNFMFAPVTTNDANSDSKTSIFSTILPLVVGASIAGAIVVFIAYNIFTWYRKRSHKHKINTKYYDLTEISNTNSTFLTFNPFQDSNHSLLSSSSETSSSSQQTQRDEESQHTENSQHSQHSTENFNSSQDSILLDSISLSSEEKSQDFAEKVEFLSAKVEFSDQKLEFSVETNESKVSKSSISASEQQSDCEYDEIQRHYAQYDNDNNV